MPGIRLDHFTIRTARPAETLRFYRDVVGLSDGWRPGFRFPGHWLYAGGRPVLHIVALSDDNAALSQYLGLRGGQGGGQNGDATIDHLAFRCSDLAAYQERLIERGVAFRERIVPDIAEHQLFAEDPNGITIELIFPHDAANRIRGEAVQAPDIDGGPAPVSTGHGADLSLKP